MLEIAKALSRNAKLVVLDEPSAVLGDQELERLFVTIKAPNVTYRIGALRTNPSVKTRAN
jgi:ABC-type sugar transport system ATPase subunit